jgi:hypothetical protein
MDAKSYSRVATIIFAIIALLQLFRALAGWDITVNGADVPLWVSWLAAVVAGALACVGAHRAFLKTVRRYERCVAVGEHGPGNHLYRFRLSSLREGGCSLQLPAVTSRRKTSSRRIR